MGDRTGIEWTDATWNPVTGCTEVSPGCDHCYAKTTAERFRGTPGHYFEHGFDVQLREKMLDLPLRWKRPRRIFVNSMSDLFHDAIPDVYIADVFAVMALAPRHTFQVLTKRHGRMRALLNKQRFREDVAIRAVVRSVFTRDYRKSGWGPLPWPIPNVWLGVSVEDQKRADLRIPALLDTPAAVRFLSCEPLLGPVDLRDVLPGPCPCHGIEREGVGWVIAGGESGRDARPMHPDWARQLRDQCQESGVPYLFKQWGQWAPTVPATHYVTNDGGLHDLYSATGIGRLDPIAVRKVGKHTAGRELDGRTWDQYPVSAF